MVFPPSMLAQLEKLADLWTKGEGNPPPTDRWSRWRWGVNDVVRHACAKLLEDRAPDMAPADSLSRARARYAKAAAAPRRRKVGAR